MQTGNEHNGVLFDTAEVADAAVATATERIASENEHALPIGGRDRPAAAATMAIAMATATAPPASVVSVGRPGPAFEDAQGRAKAGDGTLAQIHRKYGPGSIMWLGVGREAFAPVRVISTGSLALDCALGVGGMPRGRVVEIFGPESSGKTTLALHVIANAQRNRGVAAFIDAEHALDPSYAQKLGVNVQSLLISQPDCGEQALEICEMLVSSRAMDVVVIDSVAALVPRAELEGEMGDAHVGLHARLMSQALRKLTAAIARSSTCVIFINQVREKIGVMFGNPETTTGGRALKFYSSVRCEIRRVSAIKDGETTIGSRTRAHIVKNKVAPPFRKAEFDILYSRGISWTADVIDLAAERGVVEKSGAWYAFGGTKLGQGRERAIAFLEENPGILADLENQVIGLVLPERARPAGAATTAIPAPAPATALVAGSVPPAAGSPRSSTAPPGSTASPTPSAPPSASAAPAPPAPLARAVSAAAPPAAASPSRTEKARPPEKHERAERHEKAGGRERVGRWPGGVRGGCPPSG